MSILKNNKEELKEFDIKGTGYNFEIEHFSELIRAGKKESNIMSFEFSENLIKTLDEVRGVISLVY